MSVADVTHEDVVQWAFDSIELPDLEADPRAAKQALTDVIVSMNAQFAARKAAFEAATLDRLEPDEYRRIRLEYNDWKRRALHVKAAVEERLRQVKADLVARPAPTTVSPGDMVEKIRYVHRMLGEFLREIDGEAFGA